MNKWRLITDPPSRGSWNMAADYALLMSVSEGMSPPVLRFYSWVRPAITIGYFQNPETEADLAACRSLGIDVIRRATGGGAVFHERELTYSMVFPADHPFAGKDPLDSYSRNLVPFITALSSFGLDAKHAPVNDIHIGKRKVSGNAQIRRKGAVLQHGTILLDIDRDKAFRCLTVPAEKVERKGLTDPKQRVTSLREHLGERVLDLSFAGEFIHAVTAAFHSGAGIHPAPSRLSDRECASTKRIEIGIFASEAWNLHRHGELP